MNPRGAKNVSNKKVACWIFFLKHGDTQSQSQYPSGTNDLNVSVATSLHHLSSAYRNAFTQITLKITVRCTRTFPCKQHLFQGVHVSVAYLRLSVSVRVRRSSLSVSVGLRKLFENICYHESSRTQQHSEWTCVGAKRPQHMHMYSLIACD